MKDIPFQGSVDQWVSRFEQHLIQHAGLQSSTTQRWSGVIRAYLLTRATSRYGPLNLKRITPESLLSYLLGQGRHGPPRPGQVLATALRSFCRFLCVSGALSQDWSHALLPVAQRREDLPVYLKASQVNQALRTVERRTLLGKRNFAMLLCLARLGLRASEVAHLTLEDLDWRRGTVRLARTKTRRERLLPLSAELGQAFAAYLRAGPRPAGQRAVFLLASGQGPITRHTMATVASQTLRRAHLAPTRKGAHLWRHSVASRLAQQGVSLKAIADLLGHADLSTTRVYAKVDLPRLRPVALPWPKEVGQ